MQEVSDVSCRKGAKFYLVIWAIMEHDAPVQAGLLYHVMLWGCLLKPLWAQASPDPSAMHALITPGGKSWQQAHGPALMQGCRNWSENGKQVNTGGSWVTLGLRQ